MNTRWRMRRPLIVTHLRASVNIFREVYLVIRCDDERIKSGHLNGLRTFLWNCKEETASECFGV